MTVMSKLPRLLVLLLYRVLAEMSSGNLAMCDSRCTGVVHVLGRRSGLVRALCTKVGFKHINLNNTHG